MLIRGRKHKMRERVNSILILKIVVAVLVLILSITVVAGKTSSAEFHAKTMETIDDKKANVMALISLATAGSIAISAIPDDTGSSIAEELADLASYFLIVLCALYLEKYSLTLAGFAAFKIIVPVVCVLYIINIFYKSESCKKLIKKMVLLCVAVVFVVPTSVKISDMIDDTYMMSIENTLESGKEIVEAAKDEKGGIMGVLSDIKDGISSLMTKAKNMLSGIVEAFAVMIVTSCILPLLTLLFFIWIIKMILGIDININLTLPKWSKKVGHLPKDKVKRLKNVKHKSIETKKDIN